MKGLHERSRRITSQPPLIDTDINTDKRPFIPNHHLYYHTACRGLACSKLGPL